MDSENKDSKYVLITFSVIPYFQWRAVFAVALTACSPFIFAVAQTNKYRNMGKWIHKGGWKTTLEKITQYFSDACLPTSCRGAATWYLHISEAEAAPTQPRNGAPCCSPALPGKGIVAVTPLTPQSPSLLIWAIPSCSAHCPACSHPPQWTKSLSVSSKLQSAAWEMGDNPSSSSLAQGFQHQHRGTRSQASGTTFIVFCSATRTQVLLRRRKTNPWGFNPTNSWDTAFTKPWEYRWTTSLLSFWERDLLALMPGFQPW